MLKEEGPKTKISDPLFDAFKLLSGQVAEIKSSFSFLTTFIIGVMLVGFLVLLFALAGIAIDSWRFNSTIYRESTQLKIQEENAKTIVEQQKSILESINSLQQEIRLLRTKK